MNVKRTVVLGVTGGALAVWLAAAATSTSRAVAPVATPKTNVIDVSGAELAAEITRLRERLRPTDSPLQTRDLFQYARRPSARAVPAEAPAPVPHEDPIPTPAAARLKLVGIAEDVSDAGPVRTAIVSGFGELLPLRDGAATNIVPLASNKRRSARRSLGLE